MTTQVRVTATENGEGLVLSFDRDVSHLFVPNDEAQELAIEKLHALGAARIVIEWADGRPPLVHHAPPPQKVTGT